MEQKASQCSGGVNDMSAPLGKVDWMNRMKYDIFITIHFHQFLSSYDGCEKVTEVSCHLDDLITLPETLFYRPVPFEEWILDSWKGNYAYSANK